MAARKGRQTVPGDCYSSVSLFFQSDRLHRVDLDFDRRLDRFDSHNARVRLGGLIRLGGYAATIFVSGTRFAAVAGLPLE
jgi:hypothetical protein